MSTTTSPVLCFQYVMIVAKALRVAVIECKVWPFFYAYDVVDNLHWPDAALLLTFNTNRVLCSASISYCNPFFCCVKP